MNVTPIDNNSWWVIESKNSAFKVKAIQSDDGQEALICKCFSFQTVNACKHVKLVMDMLETERSFKPQERKSIGTKEWLGGDLRKQINDLINSLTY